MFILLLIQHLFSPEKGLFQQLWKLLSICRKKENWKVRNKLHKGMVTYSSMGELSRPHAQELGRLRQLEPAPSC